MKTTKDALNTDTYVNNKKLFVEVFLSLIKWQVRDETKAGKSRLSNDVVLFRTLINAHKDSFWQLLTYVFKLYPQFKTKIL